MTSGKSSRPSVVGLAVALVAVGIATAVGLTVVPLVGSYLGMFVGGLVAGLTVEKRPLFESGGVAVLASLGILTAGPLVGNGLGAAVSALASIAPTALLTSVVLSFAVGAFGAYFGDDMREGLTAPVETTPSRATESGVGPPTPRDDSEETATEAESIGNTDFEYEDDTPAAEDSSTESTSESDHRELEYE